MLAECAACFLLFVSTAGARDTVATVVSSLQAGQFTAAVEQCEVALKANPQNVRLWTLEGIAYDHLKRPQQALVAYQRALSIDRRSLAALEGAAQLEYQENDRRAISLFQQILSLRPEDATTHAMLAVMLYRAKDYKLAAVHYQNGETAIASQPVALTQYGYALAQLHRYQEAVPIFQRALALRPEGTSLRYDLALDQWLADRPRDAADTLRPLLESEELRADAVSLGVDVYESLQETPAAVELLRRAIQLRPKDVDNYLAFAMLSYNHGSFQAGLDMIDFGLKQNPQTAALYLARGILYSELSQLDKAMGDFEYADQLDPHVAMASTAEGLVHAQQHDLQAAVRSFRAEAKRHPDDALTQYLLAEALSEEASPAGSADHQEEMEAANRAVKLNPKLAQAQDLLSTVYLQEGKTNLAIEHSQAALRVSPGDQTAIYHLILALRRTSHKEEIPPLIKQLAELRQADQSATRQKQRYRLSIEAPPKSH